MRYVAIAGVPVSLVLFGCSHLQSSATPVPQSGTSPTTAQSPTAPPGKTGASATPPPDVAAGQSSAASAQAPPGGTSKPAKGPTPGRGGSANAKPPTQRNSSSAAASPGTASSNTNRASTTPTATLDLTSLEERLKDTRAIGLFTKLSLKNQVDDLLGQVRAFHAKRTTTSLSELRQRYDLLLLKVLSLLQDGDPSLAAAISSSREAIWGILADPRKFAKL